MIPAFRSGRGGWWRTKWIYPKRRENLAALRRRYPDREVVPVSAKEQEGIDDLKHALDVRLREPDLDKIDSAVSSNVETVGQGGNE